MIEFSKRDVEQYFRTYLISHFTVSKDESKLVFNSNLNGKMNLWAMDLPSTYPYQVSFKDQASNFAKFDPKGRYLLTGFDNDGDENYQIYALPTEGGKPEPVVTGEKQEKYYYSHLTKDGERLYYVTSEGNPNFLNIRKRNLKTGDDDLLKSGENLPTYLASVSPEEDSFVFIQTAANTFQVAYVNIDGEETPLTPDPSKVHTVSDVVYVNNQEVYFITNYEHGYSYLAKYDLSNKSFETVLKLADEDMKQLVFHKESSSLYIVSEQGVSDHLYRFDLENASHEKVTQPTAVIESLHVAESGNLYVLGRSAVKPHNLFKREVDNNEWQQLTQNRVLGVPEEELVDPEVITYKSYGGMEIEALHFKANPEVDNGHTVFWPHGGPQSAERKWFRAMFQVILAKGYSIFAPNFRGSSGYGAEFMKMVEGDWGRGPRLDCVHGIEWLFENDYSSPDKLFVLGGSYGGYMSLLLAGRHADLFKAVVDIFGPSDLFSFYNSVPEHWKPIMKLWLGDPEKDKERFEKDSPITYLEGMTNPMLIIQGANDPRVVKNESDQIAAALEEKGTDVEYIVLDDEGHGFSKKENEIKVYKKILEFFESHK